MSAAILTPTAAAGSGASLGPELKYGRHGTALGPAMAAGAIVVASDVDRSYRSTVLVRPRTLARAVVVRFTSRGRRDPSFGSGGVVRLPLPDGSVPVAVTSLPDGGTIIASVNILGSGSALVRLDRSGRPVTGFGSGGASLPFAVASVPISVTAVGVAGGSFYAVGNAGSEPAAVKVLANGQLDTSFGEDGVAAPTLPSGVESGGAVQVVPAAGALLVSANVRVAGQQPSAGLVYRLSADGALDTSFGRGGYALIRSTPGSGNTGPVGTGMAVDRHGRILLVGSMARRVRTGPASSTLRSAAAIVRLRRNGRLDTSFGRRGVVFRRVPSGGATGARAVAVAPRGQIVVAATGAIFRFCPRGAFAGQLTGLSRASAAGLLGLAIARNGRAYVAATAGAPKPRAAVLRFNVSQPCH